MQQNIIADHRLSTTELRKFGLTLSGILMALFGLLLPWYGEKSLPLWPFAMGGLFLLLALLLPKLLHYVYKPWMALGHGLGW